MTGDTIFRSRVQRICAIVAGALALVAVLAFAALAGPFSAAYDKQIEQASERWLPQWDWHWLKAQYFQESRLDPTARSPVGAAGIAQFMPATWKEVTVLMGLGAVDRRMAAPSIEAGAYYMARLRKGWTSRRPEGDRRRLAQASYNAGAGSLQKAQKRCNGAIRYRAIIRCLPGVTGHFSKETVTYVERIARWYAMMVS